MENGGIWSLEACYNNVRASIRATHNAAVSCIPCDRPADMSGRRAACTFQQDNCHQPHDAAHQALSLPETFISC